MSRWPFLLIGSTLIGVVGGVLVQAQVPAPLTLEMKIELDGVQGRIDHMSVEPINQRLFVAALGIDTVEVVDLAAGRRVQTLRALAEPQGVLAVPELNRLVVANARDGSVRIFDATSLAPIRSVPLGDDADNVRRDPKTGRVWVGYGGGALRAIDVNGAAGVEVPLGAHPESFQLEANGPRIFVNLPNARRIAVVDRNQGRVVASWGTGDATANFPMALDEANQRLFVVCRRPPRLMVLSTESGAVVAAIPTVGDSDDVFYDSPAKRLYVSGGEGAVAVYQQRTPDRYEQIARLPTAPGARTSVFSAELARLYVAVRANRTTPASIWVYDVAR